MKKYASACLLILMMIGFTQIALAAKPTKVEVLYMNHGPLMDTLDKMKALFSKFGNKITVSWYDFDSSGSEQFKAQKGINEHIPLVIWIDGKSTVKVGNKEIKFSGFPSVVQQYYLYNICWLCYYCLHVETSRSLEHDARAAQNLGSMGSSKDNAPKSCLAFPYLLVCR